MSAIDTQQTLAELVLERPGRAEVFEELDIDYCCGGQSTLAEAAAQRGLAPQTLVARLDAAEHARQAGGAERDWREAPLSELCDHIVDVHHAYLRRELPRIDELLARVVDRHGARAPELGQMHTHFGSLRSALTAHIDSEEEGLFPLCGSLEEGDADAAVLLQFEAHEAAHEAVGQALTRMRELAGDYRQDQAFCTTHRVLLGSLQELERDLHQHIHEENNVLFPRLRAQLGEVGATA
ncbi:MAG: iron-sulfur cluster repair di-iron protein [Solirubrobacterales bacterium]